MAQNAICDKDYIYVCEKLLFPIIRQFAPDLIIISAGFDSAKGDPLGECALSPVGYAWMMQGLRMIQPKVAVILEGGYNLESLESCTEAVFRVLSTGLTDQKSFKHIMKLLGEEEMSYAELRKQALAQTR